MSRLFRMRIWFRKSNATVHLITWYCFSCGSNKAACLLSENMDLSSLLCHLIWFYGLIVHRAVYSQSIYLYYCKLNSFTLFVMLSEASNFGSLCSLCSKVILWLPFWLNYLLRNQIYFFLKWLYEDIGEQMVFGHNILVAQILENWRHCYL